MKKILLTSLALASAALAWGQDPLVLPDAVIVGFTPDNVNAISSYEGEVMFFDLESGEDPRIISPGADGLSNNMPGLGNFAANGTIAVFRGQTGGSCLYLYGNSGIVNGRFIALPGGNNHDTMGTPNGITPDGSRICGTVSTGIGFGPEVDGTMVVPCYWERKGNTISALKRLPIPEGGDFLGQAPQYVTALCISDDGRTIIGQSRSYSGKMHELLLYTQNADSTWTVSKPLEHLVNPDSIKMPEFPGSQGPGIPSQETYMTAEQLEAYTAAVAKWSENNGPASSKPRYEYFMDADSIAKYNAAKKLSDEYDARYDEWSACEDSIIDSSMNFVYNSMAISPNGRYFTSTRKKAHFVQMADGSISETAVYYPFLYDIQEKKILIQDGPEISTTAVSDNGDLLGYKSSGDIEFGYILPAGETEWVPLEQYLKKTRPELTEWIDANWKHDVWTVTIDENGEEDGRYEEMYVTGIPYASRDFSMLSCTTYVFWNGAPAELSNRYVSYILASGIELSINEVTTPAAVGAERFYDLQGRPVAAPTHGIYITNTGKKILK